MILTKVADRAERRLIFLAQPKKGNILVQGGANFAESEHPGGISIKPKLQQHFGVVRFFSPVRVPFGERGQVQLIDNVTDDPSQVILWNPLAEIRRYELSLLRRVCFEFRHVRTSLL